MGKYRIVRNGTDDYSLIYGDNEEKEKKFHSYVEIVSDLQRIHEIAKKRMIFGLAANGKTVNDLVIKKVENGKKIEDHTNVNEMLKIYSGEVASELFNKGIEKMFNCSLGELLKDIGIDNDKQEAKNLSEDLGRVMVGRFRDKGQEKVDQ